MPLVAAEPLGLDLDLDLVLEWERDWDLVDALLLRPPPLSVE